MFAAQQVVISDLLPPHVHHCITFHLHSHSTNCSYKTLSSSFKLHSFRITGAQHSVSLSQKCTETKSISGNWPQSDTVLCSLLLRLLGTITYTMITTAGRSCVHTEDKEQDFTSTQSPWASPHTSCFTTHS